MLKKFEDLNEKQLSDMIITLWEARRDADSFVNRTRNMLSNQPIWDGSAGAYSPEDGAYKDLNEYLESLEKLGYTGREGEDG